MRYFSAFAQGSPIASIALGCVAAIIAIAVSILIVFDLSARRPLRHSKRSLLILALALAWMFYKAYDAWHIPLFADGPFTGTPRRHDPTGEPDQVFRIGENQALLVFDPIAPDSVPTVCLEKLGAKDWCIHAHAGPAKVGPIRFQSIARTKAFRKDIVGSWVEEMTQWNISHSGELLQYWRSIW